MHLLRAILILLSLCSFGAHAESESLQYLDVLNSFYKKNTIENFLELEKTFETIIDKDMKSKISFILASSEYDTKINQKSYYALYALSFYKGRDRQMVEDSYLQVITIFYYQKNLIKTKKYLDELFQLKDLNAKSLMFGKYYRGLVYASDKDYPAAINYWTAHMGSFADEILRKVIFKEIGRSYLLENARKAYSLSDKEIYQNKDFIEGVKEFAAVLEIDILLKILVNLEKEKNIKYFSAGFFAAPGLLSSNCSYLEALEGYKKKDVPLNDYFNLLKYCSSSQKNHIQIYKIIKDSTLTSNQRLLRTFVNSKGNNCIDYLETLKEEKAIYDQFLIAANGIIKDCSVADIDKNSEVLGEGLVTFHDKEEVESLLPQLMSNSNIRAYIVSNKKFKTLMANQNFNLYFWQSYVGKDKEFIEAVSSEAPVMVETFDFVIRNIINLQIPIKDKISLAQKLPGELNAEEIIRIATDKDYASQVLVKKDCLKLREIEREALLRHLLEKADVSGIQKNYACLLTTIATNSQYQEELLRVWISSDMQENVSDSSSYSAILNYVQNEKNLSVIADPKPILTGFARVQELKDIALIRDLKNLNKDIENLKKLEKTKKIFLAITKYNNLITNHAWASGSTSNRAIVLFNQLLSLLKTKITVMSSSSNINVILQRLDQWEIKS